MFLIWSWKLLWVFWNKQRASLITLNRRNCSNIWLLLLLLLLWLTYLLYLSLIIGKAFLRCHLLPFSNHWFGSWNTISWSNYGTAIESLGKNTVLSIWDSELLVLWFELKVTVSLDIILWRRLLLEEWTFWVNFHSLKNLVWRNLIKWLLRLNSWCILLLLLDHMILSSWLSTYNSSRVF